ncbi:MAG: hypothetical protein J7604_02330 [Sporocytophaga sp.]|nr:hypothetical protein [Sporocytophaga sp.]
MQGEAVKEINAEPGNVVTGIPINDGRAGIYLLKYESEGKSYSERTCYFEIDGALELIQILNEIICINSNEVLKIDYID